MSSFKKAFKLGKTSTVPSESTSPSKGTPSIGGVSSLPTRGVKPWLNGQRLVSSGHRQLDELIGGGIILGTTLLMETDLFSSLGDTFLAYNLVEALSNDQDVLILAEGALTVQSCLDSLPFNLTLSDELITVASQSAESGLKTKDNLSIAWQYEKYIDKGSPYCVFIALRIGFICVTVEKESRVKSSRDSFCYSYDLSRRFLNEPPDSLIYYNLL